MADLSINFAGIRSPNPFWLASAPPTNSGMQIHRAFEAGWGGAVWKTIGAPCLNVSNRYGAWHSGSQKMLAINNVELISDRPLEVNLREIAEVKRAWPDRAVVVSAMVESMPEAWHDIIRRIQDTGADGIELNYGCPHGMSERGMGSAVGQVPEYCEQITRWVMEVAKLPVIVKLTPNVANIVMPARAAVAAGANALSLINTVNSIIGVDLDTLEISPNIGGKGGTHIHHMTFGIIGNLIVGYMWILQLGTAAHPSPRLSRITSFLFGAGAALTLDEFALWLNLEDDYWTSKGRESIDAVVLFGTMLSLGALGGGVLPKFGKRIRGG